MGITCAYPFDQPPAGPTLLKITTLRAEARAIEDDVWRARFDSVEEARAIADRVSASLKAKGLACRVEMFPF